MREVTVRAVAESGLAMHVEAGPHAIRGDEPVDVGGTDTGFAPHELLLAALGTCTVMTLRLYAARKAWPLSNARSQVSGGTVEGVFRIRQTITLEGDLNDEQRTRLLEIAARCPVHRTLTGTIQIDTLQGGGS